MDKWKLPLILMLTVALIVTGMFLPVIAGLVMDGLSIGKAAAAPMQSVELSFSTDEEKREGYMLKKLALEREMTSFPVTAGEASMSEEDVFTAVEAQMDRYVAAGVFQWFEPSYRSAEPYLFVSGDSSNNMSIIWAVHIVQEADPYQNLFLHLDDETGSILYMDYVNTNTDEYLYNPDVESAEKEMWSAMDAFTGVYFSQRGLTEQAETERSGTQSDYTYLYTEPAEGASAVYVFTDTGYGDVTIQFVLKYNGFYIMFPN